MDKKNIKRIRFDFYQVYLHKKGGRIKDDSLFDLDDWIELISNVSKLAERNVGYNGDIVRCDNVYVDHPDKNPLTIFHFTKLRSGTAPAIANLNLPDLSDVSLKSDEYIAEDVSGLYDSSSHVVMLQKNIFSLSATAISNYMSYFWQKQEGHEQDIIEFRPVIRKDAFRSSLKANAFKELIVKTANLKKGLAFPDNILSSGLNNVIEAMKQYSGATIEVRIRPRRVKESYLDKEEVKDTINEIEANKQYFKKATVVTENVNQTKETIELLCGLLHIYLEFNIPLKTYLDPSVVQQDMITKYSLNYDERYKDTVDRNLLIK